MELSPRARVGVVFALVAMLLAAGMVGYGMGYQRGLWDGPSARTSPSVHVPQRLSVPDVVDEPLEAAHERLRGLQFEVGYERAAESTGTGAVAAIRPEPGTIVERGSQIVVVEADEST